jgi:hypothetical protein
MQGSVGFSVLGASTDHGRGHLSKRGGDASLWADGFFVRGYVNFYTLNGTSLAFAETYFVVGRYVGTTLRLSFFADGGNTVFGGIAAPVKALSTRPSPLFSPAHSGISLSNFQTPIPVIRLRTTLAKSHSPII